MDSYPSQKLALGSLIFAASAFGVAQTVAKSPAEAKPLAVGVKVPNATLRTLGNEEVKLHDVLRDKPSVVIFYRGDWCPYCNAHLSDLATMEPEFEKRGYQIVAISPDSPADLNKTMTKDHLNYKLFSDSSAEAIKKFGVGYRLDDATFTTYRDKYHVDLEKSSGQAHHILPVPSVFIIDKSGKITFVHSNPDYKVRLKASEILRAMDRK